MTCLRHVKPENPQTGHLHGCIPEGDGLYLLVEKDPVFLYGSNHNLAGFKTLPTFDPGGLEREHTCLGRGYIVLG